MSSSNAAQHDTPTYKGRTSFPLSSYVLSGLFSFIDTILIAIAGLVAYSCILGNPFYIREIYLFAIFFIFSSYFFVGRYAGIYEFSAIMTPLQTISRIGGTCAITFLLLLALAFSLNISGEFSRFWIYSFFGFSFLYLALARIGGYWLLRMLAAKDIICRRIVIVGAGPQATHLIKELNEGQKYPLNRILGVFDDRASRIEIDLRGIPLLGNIEALKTYCRKQQVDDIIVALPWHADERQVSIVSQLRELPAHVHLASDLVGFRYPNKPSPRHFGTLPMIEVVDSPLSGWGVLLKWLEDKILSFLLLLMFSPVFLCLAIAIRLESKGPVLFKQKRFGYNNQEFEIYKFRSMYHDSVPTITTKQATKDDPRITKVGKFIRRTSLDELPQLLNVFFGSMSLVGPRPHAVDHNEEYSELIEGYFGRHRVKPGITGWAQVNGLRGETDTLKKMEARVQHDMYYCENWSLLFDMQILIKTLFVGFINKNAY
ncbi:undecaprenyl-phosphate glucose phosphotransferase [Sneathiella glossodoripedis]|uniref:undecaprenyl-phosphate glucose phosphotransferase n=1 Tax=Sneathiella glossodoripedis TaxID=418853 RepID=UPI0004712BE5|nr:undecaprenyl-phosphate glucose phosphotransferase [Sneathiella glossodoripedis]